MPRFPLEYTLCQIQSGRISLAVRTHRREDRNPELEVSVHPDSVIFTLAGLLDGVPQTILGERRQDHVDFYFLLEEFRSCRGRFPTVSTPANDALLLRTVDPSGMERCGGKPIRMDLGGPMFRLPVEEVVVESIRDPVFRARSNDSQLFVDFETTPSTGLYTRELPELHFGIGGDFEMVEAEGVARDVCHIHMTHEQYATWRNHIFTV